MNRALWVLLTPEAAAIAVTGGVFWFCSRYPSGQGRDVQVLERLVMLLPLLVVPLVFGTILVPGARNWGWLLRIVVCAFVALSASAGRIVSGFGEGAKGQDAGFMMAVVFGLVLVSLGTAIAAAWIRCDTHPGFAAWFRLHRITASLLTLLAAIPIGIGLGIALTAVLGLILGLWSAFKS